MNLNPIIGALCTTAELFGQTLTKPAAMMMATELEAFPPEQVQAALRDCVRSLKGRLTLADILERLQNTDGHPSPNEAWALALQAASQPSVAVTFPVREAFKRVKALLDFGDKTGARMAFIETYTTLVQAARAQRKPADWKAPPKPAESETWQQNALPKPEINPDQARANLAVVRDMIKQTVRSSEQQKSEEDEQHRAQLRAQARHFAQLEQEARELKREAVAA